MDLRDDKEEVERTSNKPVSIEEGIRLQSMNDNVVKYMECSALTLFGVKEVFDEAMRAGLKYNTVLANPQPFAPQRTCVII